MPLGHDEPLFRREAISFSGLVVGAARAAVPADEHDTILSRTPCSPPGSADKPPTAASVAPSCYSSPILDDIADPELLK